MAADFMWWLRERAFPKRRRHTMILQIDRYTALVPLRNSPACGKYKSRLTSSIHTSTKPQPMLPSLPQLAVREEVQKQVMSSHEKKKIPSPKDRGTFAQLEYPKYGSRDSDDSFTAENETLQLR
jgi:hypothetical protein